MLDTCGSDNNYTIATVSPQAITLTKEYNDLKVEAFLKYFPNNADSKTSQYDFVLNVTECETSIYLPDSDR